MTVNQIPLSTAVFDPKWFHDFKDQNHIFKDKNGVYNGLRLKTLVPDKSCYGLCNGRESCFFKNPKSCDFLKAYRNQLDKIDFGRFLKSLLGYVETIRKLEKSEKIDCYDFILLVHESPDNHCSERVIIQDWLQSNGIHIVEWRVSK